MKRIYFTACPLDSNFTVTEKEIRPVNFTWKNSAYTGRFPIVPVIAETAQPGDEIVVIAVRQKNSDDSENLAFLKEELASLPFSELEFRETVTPETQNKDILINLFAELTSQLENHACYYACVTFGTKTFPLVMFSVLSYADKLKEDVTVKGIYYQEIKRSCGTDTASNLYDITALFTLNSIIDTVANLGGENPEAAIKMLLNR